MFRTAFEQESSTWLKKRRPFLQAQPTLSWSQFFPCTHRDLRGQQVATSSVLRALLERRRSSQAGILRDFSYRSYSDSSLELLRENRQIAHLLTCLRNVMHAFA